MTKDLRNRALIIVLVLAPLSAAWAADTRGLKEELITQLRAGRPVEIAYINGVVDLVEQDKLPFPLVRSVMLWARHRQPYPFFYFRSAMDNLAKKLEVEIVPRL